LQVKESNGLSGYLHCIELLTESGGRQIAESCLLSNPVVEDFNVLRDLAFGLLPGGEAAMMHQFGLQGAPTAFHWGIVPTVTLATHGGLHAELPEQFLVAWAQYWLPRSEW
jgi:hypothetical protein